MQAVLKSEKNQTSQYCTLQYSRNSDTKYHSFSTEDENQDVIGIRHFFYQVESHSYILVTYADSHMQMFSLQSNHILPSTNPVMVFIGTLQS